MICLGGRRCSPPELYGFALRHPRERASSFCSGRRVSAGGHCQNLSHCREAQRGDPLTVLAVPDEIDHGDLPIRQQGYVTGGEQAVNIVLIQIQGFAPLVVIASSVEGGDLPASAAPVNGVSRPDDGVADGVQPDVAFRVATQIVWNPRQKPRQPCRGKADNYQLPQFHIPPVQGLRQKNGILAVPTRKILEGDDPGRGFPESGLEASGVGRRNAQRGRQSFQVGRVYRPYDAGGAALLERCAPSNRSPISATRSHDARPSGMSTVMQCIPSRFLHIASRHLASVAPTAAIHAFAVSPAARRSRSALVSMRSISIKWSSQSR